MATQRDLIATALREAHPAMFGYGEAGTLDEALQLYDKVAERLAARGIVSTQVSDGDGCGSWLPIDGHIIEAAPAEWWSCVIPDAEHQGRDCMMVPRRRD